MPLFKPRGSLRVGPVALGTADLCIRIYWGKKQRHRLLIKHYSYKSPLFISSAGKIFWRLLGLLQAGRVHKGFGDKEQQLMPLRVKWTMNQYPGSTYQLRLHGLV